MARVKTSPTVQKGTLIARQSGILWRVVLAELTQERFLWSLTCNAGSVLGQSCGKHDDLAGPWSSRTRLPSPVRGHCVVLLDKTITVLVRRIQERRRRGYSELRWTSLPSRRKLISSLKPNISRVAIGLTGYSPITLAFCLEPNTHSLEHQHLVPIIANVRVSTERFCAFLY